VTPPFPFFLRHIRPGTSAELIGEIGDDPERDPVAVVQAERRPEMDLAEELDQVGRVGGLVGLEGDAR
jgi:hypothetical protein